MTTGVSGIAGSAPQPIAMRRGRVTDRTVLLVASFGAFLAFLDATIVNVAFPSIRASFDGSSISSLSWILNAYNIVFAAFLVISGRLADLAGRRRAFISGVLVFTAASAMCAMAGSVGLLVGARMIQALGAAILVPASLALVVEAFPAHRRAHAVGLWGASAALASGLGPPIGGALVEAGGWRWAFLVNLPFGLAALWAGRRLLVESRAPGRRRLPDLKGAVLSAAMLGLLTLGIVKGNDWGWTSWQVLGCFAGAGLLFAGFVVSSRRHRSPLLDPALLRIRSFAVGNLAMIIAGMGFYAYLLTNILWLQYVWGYSVLRAGLALVPAALVAAVLAAVLGPVAEKRGYRLVIIPGALVWALAYLWYATRVGSTPDFLGQWLPGQLLSGLGVGATLPVLGSASLAAVPGGRFATASAVNSSARQIGAVLGIAILVVIIGTPTPATAATDLRHGWVFSSLCFVAVAIVAGLAGRVRAGHVRAADADEHQAALVRLPDVPRTPAAAGAATVRTVGGCAAVRPAAGAGPDPAGAGSRAGRGRGRGLAVPCRRSGRGPVRRPFRPARGGHRRRAGAPARFRSGARRAGPAHRRGALGLGAGPSGQPPAARLTGGLRGRRRRRCPGAAGRRGGARRSAAGRAPSGCRRLTATAAGRGRRPRAGGAGGRRWPTSW